jgi:prepilin signal peptidase PulO-like enzyme (type II secretory pathway)
MYSILRGRSMCPHCKHLLSYADLIPLFSWLGLRGKCRYCKKRISAQYPLIELSTLVLFLISYFNWPHALQDFSSVLRFSGWLIVIVGLIILTLFDFKRFLLPSRIIYSLIALSLAISILSALLSRNFSIILLPLLSSLIFFAIFFFMSTLSSGKWIGGGDVRLALLLGLQFNNPIFVFITLFIASVAGILFAIPALRSKKMTIMGRIPFGPFLILGTFISVLFGENIIHWYVNILR